MISMGGSASRDSGSAKAVCALNMAEFCCSCVTSQQEKSWILRGLLSNYKGWSLLGIPEEQNVYKALDQTLDFFPEGWGLQD